METQYLAKRTEAQFLFWGLLLSFWILTILVCIIEYIISVSRLRSLLYTTALIVQSKPGRFDGKVPNVEGLRDTTLRLGVALIDLVMGVILGAQTFVLAPKVTANDLDDKDTIEHLVCFQVGTELLLLLFMPLVLDAIIAFVRASLVFNGPLLVTDNAMHSFSVGKKNSSKLFYGALLVTTSCCVTLVIFPFQPTGKEFCLEAYPGTDAKVTTSIAVSAWAAVVALAFTLAVSIGVVYMWTAQHDLYKVLMIKSTSWSHWAAQDHELDNIKPDQTTKASDDEQQERTIDVTMKSVALNPEQQVLRNRKDNNHTQEEVSPMSNRRVTLSLWRAMGCPWLPWLMATIAYPYLSSYQMPSNIILLLLAIESCVAILWSAFLNIAYLA